MVKSVSNKVMRLAFLRRQGVSEACRDCTALVSEIDSTERHYVNAGRGNTARCQVEPEAEEEDCEGMRSQRAAAAPAFCAAWGPRVQEKARTVARLLEEREREKKIVPASRAGTPRTSRVR